MKLLTGMHSSGSQLHAGCPLWGACEMLLYTVSPYASRLDRLFSRRRQWPPGSWCRMACGLSWFRHFGARAISRRCWCRLCRIWVQQSTDGPSWLLSSCATPNWIVLWNQSSLPCSIRRQLQTWLSAGLSRILTFGRNGLVAFNSAWFLAFLRCADGQVHPLSHDVVSLHRCNTSLKFGPVCVFVALADVWVICTPDWLCVSDAVAYPGLPRGLRILTVTCLPIWQAQLSMALIWTCKRNGTGMCWVFRSSGASMLATVYGCTAGLFRRSLTSTGSMSRLLQPMYPSLRCQFEHTRQTVSVTIRL